jgi:transcriptional regulator with XRE-family HTH domain
MRFSEAVREARRTRGMSQGQLAGACGWTRSKQSHIETGRYGMPNEADRAKLESTLNCSFVTEDAGETWSVVQLATAS